MQALPTTTAHLLRQKPPPSSRFGSPARSLPPYLRSYRNFTQTALLGSTSAQSSDSRLSPRPQTHSPRSGPRLKAHGQSSNSASQRSAELQLSALREAAQRSSSCNRGAKQEGAGPNTQCLSAHPDYRSVRQVVCCNFPDLQFTSVHHWNGHACVFFCFKCCSLTASRGGLGADYCP